MTYVAPMRRAVIWLCSLGKPWDLRSLVNAADVEQRRASAYVTTLERAKALVYAGDLLLPGSRYQHFALAKVTTRPGGNSARYRAAAAIRDAHYMEDVDDRRIVGHQLREKRLAADATLQDVAQRSGICFQHLSKVERGTEGISPMARDRVEQALEESYQLLLKALEDLSP